MSLHPDHPALKPLPDFETQAIELSHQLLVARAATQEKRLANLNDEVWQAMQSLPEIDNKTIGK